MDLKDINSVYLILAFFVPGFIIHSTLASFIPQGKEDEKVRFLRFFTLSCWNYALWSWLVYLILRGPVFQRQPLLAAGAWFVVLLLGPLIMASMLSKGCRQRPRKSAPDNQPPNGAEGLTACDTSDASRAGVLRAWWARLCRIILGAIGYDPVGSLPTAWDYKFNARSEAVKVRVTLQDGTSILGMHADKSAASVSPSPPDIFLERVLERDEQGNFISSNPHRSILICAGQVKMVEFFEDIYAKKRG